MADEKKISRRSFLKGAAAAGAVAATGIPTKAGPDKFTTMLSDLKKDFRAIENLQIRSDALRSSPPTIAKMLQEGKITKSFANKILPLTGPDPTGEKLKKKKKFRAQFEEQYKKLVPAYNEKLDKTRGYAEKNNKRVAINGAGDVTKLKPGQTVTYPKVTGDAGRRAAAYPGAGVVPQITTPQKKKPKRKPKSAVKGGRGGAGAGRDEAGVHTIFEGPKIVKTDYRKGGMILSRTDNRKKK